MNPDYSNNERAKLEAKLTALLLGELHADEVAALSKAMEADPELAALYERLKITIELVREGAAKPAELTAPLKLSTERREKLLAQFKTVTPAAFAKPRRRMDWLAPWAAAAAVIAIFFGYMAIPNFIRTRGTSKANTIVNNLRLLDGAQSQWALENGKTKDAEPSLKDLAGYIGRGEPEALKSIDGEVYVPGKGSESPRVELDVAQAKRLFGRQVVDRAEIRDGKALISMDDVAGGTIASAAPQMPAVVPQYQSEPMPMAASPISSTPAVPIVLPAERPLDLRTFPGQMVAVYGNAGEAHLENADPAQVNKVLQQFQQTNLLALNQRYWGSASDRRELMVVPDAAGEKFQSHAVAANDWTIDTHNLVGGTNTQAQIDSETLSRLRRVSADTYNPQASYRTLSQLETNSTVLSALSSQALSGYVDTSAQWNLGAGSSGQSAAKDLKLAVDSPRGSEKVPILGDVPALGRAFTPLGPTFTSESKLADQNGDFQTGLTREDVNGLRYLYTNATVASQPLGGDAIMWGAVTNAAAGYSLVEADSRIVAANSGAHVGGTIRGADQAQQVMRSTQSSVLMNREKQTSVDRMEITELATIGSFGGGGGGGFGGGGAGPAPTARRAVGGKQVELAAVANPSAAPRDSNRLGTETLKVDPNTFYRGLQNVGTINLGGTTNTPSETSPKGLRYVTGLDSTSETQLAISNLLKAVGVDLDPAKGKSVFFNDRQGTLTVRGTEDDLELVKQAIETLNIAPPEVSVKARFVEVNTNDSRALGFDWYLGNKFATNGAVVTSSGTMPSSSPSDSKSNSWWNVTPTVRGLYDDTASKVAAGSNTTADYFAAQQQLKDAARWREVLAMKAGQEKVDASLPRSQMVSVINPAMAEEAGKPGLGEKIKRTLTGKVERTASIQIEQERPDIGGLSGAPVAQGYEPYFLQTEFETIKSDAVLKKAVEALNLDGGDKLKTEEAVKQLRNNLDFGVVKNTKFIEIGATSKKPEEAARIANAVAEAYKEYRAEEYADVKKHGIESLEQQLSEQDKKIQGVQARVDELRKNLNVPDAMASASSVGELRPVDVLKELSLMRVQKESEYNQQATLLKTLKSMDRQKLRTALPIVSNDTQLNSLLSDLTLAQQALIKLEIDHAPDDPKYKNARKAEGDLNHQIDDRVDGIIADLESKVAAAKSSLDTMTEKMKATQKDLDDPAYLAAKAQLQVIMAQGGQGADTALPKPAVPPPTPQPEILTSENAFSTFSLNVSDVSFKLAGASLTQGQMPEPASIRSEEFINAFDYRDPEAGPGVPIAFASERARYPFAHNRELLRFSLKTAAAGRQAGRSLNIVLLLDNSGSMERADRVRIIQEAMRVLAGQLQASDTFSIVTFARTAQLRVDGIPGNQAAAAAEEIAKLTPEGGTNLGDALDLAYQTALRHYLANGDNRVVLLTDGAANLGDVQPESLKQKVEAHRQQGVALDCFGIGWEGYNDDLLETLTRNGDGRYGFINTPEEANTEFVAQIAGALHVAASDVKVQVEFNPKRVTSYRQIGYAKHQLTKEQFRDNTVDAAEIASQEAGNALYTTEINPEGEGSIATVRVRYKVPGTAEYREQSWDVPYTGGAVAMDQATPAMRLAATASAFSEWLATSPFAAEVSTEELLKYLSGVPQVYGADARPAKLEWMIRQARSISGK